MCICLYLGVRLNHTEDKVPIHHSRATVHTSSAVDIATHIPHCTIGSVLIHPIFSCFNQLFEISESQLMIFIFYEL